MDAYIQRTQYNKEWKRPQNLISIEPKLFTDVFWYCNLNLRNTEHVDNEIFRTAILLVEYGKMKEYYGTDDWSVSLQQ